MRIAVLLGGTSAERDVSIVTGLRVIEALRSLGHEVTGVDPASGELTPAMEAALHARRVLSIPPSIETLTQMSGASFSPLLATIPAIRDAAVVFIGLHGGSGEDGTIQALLDLAGVRYTGSGHLASALAMDKDLSKHLFRSAGVPTPDWAMVSPGISAIGMASHLGFPLVVKPSKQGSTVGLTVVRDPGQLEPAIAEARRYDDEVMLEQFIVGRELTVGILGAMALPVGEIIPQHEIYDYECKYTPGMAREEFPAQLSAGQTNHVQQLARLAFGALKLRGCARVDFRLATDGTFFCLEANTLPGLTHLSNVPQAAAACGISFAELCDQIVHLALTESVEPVIAAAVTG